MKLLHICPANIATGGTENIHQLIHEMNRQGIDAGILYTGADHSNPQPEDYKHYECPYVTTIPQDFKGVLIFPEIYANQALEPKYAGFKKAVNWQGVDVYYWHNPAKPEPFLKDKSLIHFTTMDYGMDHLQNRLGLDAIKVNDCLNDDFFEDLGSQGIRDNVILYNPTRIKMTRFQEIVMQRCKTEYGIKFQPIQGYTRQGLIELFKSKKLYIDFGQFSGRERLPREAVMCGCCILTSKNGAAGYYGDLPIPDEYKLNDMDDDQAVTQIRSMLKDYEAHRADFDIFRESLKADKEVYPSQVKELCNAFFNSDTSI